MDPTRDLAALVPTHALQGGLLIRREAGICVGSRVATWGFPLGYNGPSPLLSVGYLAGFADSPPYEQRADIVKHLVVNGAFNPGNSGGPLILFGDKAVVGVVVSKHAPMSGFVRSAIDELGKTRSGVVFNYVDDTGQSQHMVEAQVVAEVLKHFRDLTQVMIGEAIASSELMAFLRTNGLPFEETGREESATPREGDTCSGKAA